jgi:hypothetical protein
MLAVLLELMVAMPLAAQDSGQTPPPTPGPQSTPIPASDIPAVAAKDTDVARLAVANATPGARIRDIQPWVPGPQFRSCRVVTAERRTWTEGGVLGRCAIICFGAYVHD